MKINTKLTLGAIATTAIIVGGIVYFTPPVEELTGHKIMPVEIPKEIVKDIGLTMEEIDLLDYEVKQIDTIYPEGSISKNELWDLVVDKVKNRVVSEKSAVKVGLKSLEVSEYKTKRSALLNKL